MALLANVLTKIFGKKSDRDLKELEPFVEKINVVYSTLSSLTDEELKQRIQFFKDEIVDRRNNARETGEAEGLKASALDEAIYSAEQDYLNEISIEVFAIVKDASRRLMGTHFKVMGQEMSWEMVHYDVQLIGGVVLHQGKITEMKTGEGKTLVSTLAIVLNALTGRGVHIITVNDYLAERDSQWMGLLYNFLGLSVGCILNQMNNENRREMYNRDITYGMNSEFGFDFLRDNMSVTTEEQVQRGHYYAIVDEVDSVLVDEARVPLIISGQVDAPQNQRYKDLMPQVKGLVRQQTELVNTFVADGEKLLDTDEQKAGEKLLVASKGMPKNRRLMKLYQRQGVKQLIRSVESEYIRDKKVHEIDEQLYFSVDERSNIIDLTEMGRHTLSPSNPEGFVIPDLGELFHEIENDETLSDKEILLKKDEAQSLHAERSDKIHTINQLLKAFTLFEKDVDYIVQEGKVMIVDEHTGRVLHGRRYSDGLHQSLEAKENVTIERETQTIATITIQNYFRMYEKLAGMTGTASTEAPEFMQIYNLDVVEIPTNVSLIRKDNEDYIYKTKREKYIAVINKVIEVYKKGQPVLVGTTSVEESETLSRMLRRDGIPHNVLNAKKHQSEAEIITRAGQISAVTISTNMAGRGTDIKLGKGVKAKGGLLILGTGRHESRRIDLQLRGRSGRQGDAGESVFYLSLEDDLMRLFGSDRIAKIMDRMGIQEGEVITHAMVSKSIERAQKKVESHNFGIRKHLLEYDDVMNQQREVVYDRRSFALHGESINREIQEILNNYAEAITEMFCESNTPYEWDWDGINLELLTTLSLDIKQDDVQVTNHQEFKDMIVQAANALLVSKKELVDEELFDKFMKYVVLRTIDEKWREHLHSMDQLREGINLRAYGQKNPLVEYKQEGFGMFTEMMQATNQQTLHRIFKARIGAMEKAPTPDSNVPRNMMAKHDDSTGMGFVAAPQGGQQQSPARPQSKAQPIKTEEKVGRNEPCPCGSGKKYKKCHGKMV
ncbi:MAG: preprotein translocase subunit SecA [Candidatus Marinimicrobia bacterium]|nr:preprotein translocase subunit SecA [Candidatus Neomarinimicrobiota bacterium]MBL7022797.1 preprotein translocase subunit SecA [Candidatus Neomarinimicrobiota bacterium]MBL7109364.1 preprotein translocase subunit SecA [Candidatus Neomarinimicrobiota bacterium]